MKAVVIERFVWLGEWMRAMMTSSNGNIFRATGHLCGEFTGHRWIPRTKASDAELCFFYLRLNKWLSKQSWGWWLETPSRSKYQEDLWTFNRCWKLDNRCQIVLSMYLVCYTCDCMKSSQIADLRQVAKRQFTPRMLTIYNYIYIYIAK